MYVHGCEWVSGCRNFDHKSPLKFLETFQKSNCLVSFSMLHLQYDSYCKFILYEFMHALLLLNKYYGLPRSHVFIVLIALVKN